MSFSFKKSETKLSLTLIGDIDLELTPDLKQKLSTELEDATALDIDGSNVTYIDSSGVSVLVIAMQSCKKSGINLTISKVSEQLLRVLQLAHLTKLLPIGEETGPADLRDVDVFSGTGDKDSRIASRLNKPDDEDSDEPDEENSEDDAIAADIASLMTKSEPAEKPMEGDPTEPESAPADSDADPSSFKPGTF